MKTVQRGFTLIELMVVISVIAILATISLFGIGRAQASARDVKRQQIMNGIRTALERYYGDYQSYPTDNWTCMIGRLVNGGYLSSRPLDPQNNADVSCGADPQPCWDRMTMNDGSIWCNVTWEASYDYSGSANSYILTLYKAGGGTNRFTSPN